MKYNSPAAPYTIVAASGYPLTAVGKTLTGVLGGNGITKNLPFPVANDTANFGDLEIAGTEYQATYNNGYYSRLKKLWIQHRLDQPRHQIYLVLL